jgi:competence protein ComEC
MPSPTRSIRAPLLWLLLPLMTGLAAAKAWPVPPGGVWPVLLGAGLAAAGALACSWRDRNTPAMLALVAAGTMAGFALLPLRFPQLGREEMRPAREATLTIRVSALFGTYPGARSQGGVGIVSSAGSEESDLVGSRIYFSVINRISVPARVSGTYLLEGVLEPLSRDPGGAGFHDYLANLGIRQQLVRGRLIREVSPPTAWANWTESFRARLGRILGRGLERHPETASLYLAMLLGEKVSLSPDQQTAFMRSGTYHVFSVSGLHVGVIALALQLGLSVLRVTPRPGAIASLAVLWLYVQVTGAGTPSVRAFVMVAFLLAMRAFRLPGNALAALTASALVTLLADPLQLFSTGFQMSYAVVAALILMGAPLAERWGAIWHPFVLRPRPEWRWWHDFIDWAGRKAITAGAGCWVAFLASIPAGIGFFGVLAPGSLPANLLVLPLSSLAIVAGFLSLLTGLAGLLPLSALFNSAAALILLATDTAVRHGTNLPGMHFPATFRAGGLAPAGMALMTAVMLAGAAGHWRGRWGGFWPPVAALALLLIFGVKFG